MTAHTADFWFDPVCPWAWMTSRWIMEVEQIRDVSVRWHIMSLSVLNENQDLEPDYRERMDRSWGPARVVNAVRELHGEDMVKPLYDALGERIHLGQRKYDEYDAVIAESLASLDLPADLKRFASSDELDESLRASTAQALTLVGQDVGTPIVSVAGTAFFGPVVSPTPRGEAAGKLWDGCLLVAGTPGFFELKRSRTVGPIFD